LLVGEKYKDFLKMVWLFLTTCLRFFTNGLIVPYNLPIGEKYKDFSRVV
jgi:hypothetical protein